MVVFHTEKDVCPIIDAIKIFISEQIASLKWVQCILVQF